MEGHRQHHAREPHTHDHDLGPEREHGHEHSDQHGDEHSRAHDQSHGPDAHTHAADSHEHHSPGRWSRVRHQLAHVVTPHSHDAADRVDSELEASARGMRTLWVSLAVLGATAVLQAVVVVFSGSVALLGDSLHNAADALTAVPLAVAFVLGRRQATRRFSYGFGRAEDLAGVAIVLTIAASSVAAGWTAIDRLMHPRAVTNVALVAIAAVVGFIGNEWVARYRIRTGRAIGSAALVADGLHARTDGFTSLAVLVGAIGSALGWHAADPVVGLLITVAIALVLRDAAREVFRRLMDAVDPALLDAAESAIRAVPGVHGIGELRMRWIGHRLRAEAAIHIDGSLSLHEAHRVAVDTEHALLHAVPRLTAALIHPDPVSVSVAVSVPVRVPGSMPVHVAPDASEEGASAAADPHSLLAHHRAVAPETEQGTR